MRNSGMDGWGLMSLSNRKDHTSTCCVRARAVTLIKVAEILSHTSTHDSTLLSHARPMQVLFISNQASTKRG